MFPALETLRGLTTYASADELTVAVDRLTKSIGVSHWFYAINLPLIDDRHAHFSLGGYPPGWLERYLEMQYLQIDPLVSHCHDHATPLSWAEAVGDNRAIADPRLQKVRRMFGEAGEFGLGAGVSVPLHGPGVCWGLMSFACDARNGEELSRRMPELHLLAHFVHEAGRHFARARTQQTFPALTKRERECLFWAAQGKTSWEIGQLLVISERTVIFHLQNAAQKLGVCGRQAAIARAISMGLIAPQ
ncbi:helix-turn-helix transcriptional regulator [Montanilutibacter psychrotolerans]|uniref:LuxR family transcriptional regulator n=1 Tax=Montanilutibacter psychrotolerans TaxID=1327343 RepID=A0A3M8SUB0_9GAMM|nr:LuxR family transcriptional regulator [Lysobacter psychrotolerans]RNF84373.1 LuxR family transcriptional regulator [Lysobacter psychrotolerans]